MKKPRGHSSFPAAFLTFSLLLLVLAIGFAVGRLVVGQLYLKGSRGLKWAAAEAGERPLVEPAAPPGRVHVPSAGEPSPEEKLDSGGREAAGTAPGAEPEPEPDASGREEPREEPLPVETSESAPAAGDTRYAIQVGMFESEQGARRVAEELTRAGYPARIEVGRGERGDLYRVLTGRYRTEYAARKAMEQLQKEGFPGFLTQR